MKACVLAVSLLLALKGSAQMSPAFKTLRYEEDYSALKSDSNRSDYSKFKYVEISPDGYTYVSNGGEIRYQYFYIKNENWSDTPRDQDGFLLSRFLLHTDLHTGRNIRIFVQLQGSMANGKATGTSPVDENPLDLHQLFLDINTPSKKAVFRVGRQELSYGSQRLISVRELPNNRQSFDAVKAIFSADNFRADVFYGRYVSAQKGIFDDISNGNIKLFGAYFVKNQAPIFKNIDLYCLGLSKEQSQFEDGSGKELRYSAGARIWGAIKSWKYDLEGLYQFGRFTDKRISAWTISSNTSYKLIKVKLKPELGLKTEIISGDQRQGDKGLQTFDPLFPRGAYFGLAALIGPSNLFDVHPSIAFELIPEKFTCAIDYDVFWRYSVHDGIYAPDVSLIYPAGNSLYKHIGNQLSADFSITPNRYLLIRIESTWFRSGAFLEDAGAEKDIVLFGLTSQLKF